ncbi:MAG: DUF805 domain-containing protein [Culicoidibacterales bacterium]
MKKSLILFLDSLFSFKGRATRSEFWYVYLWLFFIKCVFVGITYIFLVPTSSTTVSTEQQTNPSLVLLFIILSIFSVSVLLLIGQFTLTVRRLHDIGKSGLWLFLLAALPIGLPIMYVLMCLKSEPHTNQYGPYELFEQK